MRSTLGVLLALGLWSGASQARAELTPGTGLARHPVKFGNWGATCDGQGGCSAWGMGTSWASPGYIILATGADGRRVITLGAYDTNHGRPLHAPLLFTLEIVDDHGHVIWSRPFPGRDESRIWLWARMTKPAEVDRALQALAGGREARLRVDGQAEPATVVSLNGSAAALLWARSHDGVDAAAPVIRRAPPASQARLPRSRPRWEPSEYEAACPSEKATVKASRLAPGKVLWITTCEIGYNNDSILRLADERGRLLETPAIETPPGIEVGQNFTFDPATRTLSSTFYGNSTWTCGDAYRWVWDGARFRFSSRSRMEECEGMGETDWPVSYRARIVDR
jgi:hypothetical protein